jgi:hypothetical protein
MRLPQIATDFWELHSSEAAQAEHPDTAFENPVTA